MGARVLVITGPTATGKTALGAALAKKLGGEVISADSMQVYKFMDIGTAKPTPEETLGVPHHMIDVASPFESYSVSRYVEEASAVADDIIARGALPVIVGGTGLYIDSLISGRVFAESSNAALRDELYKRYDDIGGEAMLAELRAFDPASAQRLPPADKKRIVRAFEVYRLTGKTITEHNEETKKLPPKYDAVRIALTFRDRAALYARIDGRVDKMMGRGLLSEVRSLLDMGLKPGSTAMAAIGYKELTRAILGECSIDEAVEDIKRGSRRYAKRQLSWLRVKPDVNWLLWDKEPDISYGILRSTEYMA